MRKRNWAFLLPIAAVLALAGTGFGSWVYTTGAKEAMIGADIELTDAFGYRDLQVTWNDTKSSTKGVKQVKLEQPERDTSSSATNLYKTDDAGLIIADIPALKFFVCYTMSGYSSATGTFIPNDDNTSGTYSYSEGTWSASTFGYTLEITVNDALAPYVTFSYSAVTKANSGNYSPVANDSNTGVVDTPLASGDIIVDDCVEVKPTWVNSKIPKSISEYSTLRKVITDATTPLVTIKVTMGDL